MKPRIDRRRAADLPPELPDDSGELEELATIAFDSNAAEQAGFVCADDGHIAREKQKAREIRQSGWWRQQLAKGICGYCGGKFSPSELTMDHKIPIVRGGKSVPENLVPCCKACNNSKKYQLLSEWQPEKRQVDSENQK